jgi:hypothetical protein
MDLPYAARLFTVDEANALVPHIEALFSGIRPQVKRARELTQDLAHLGVVLPLAGQMAVDAHASPQVQALQQELKGTVDRLVAWLRQVSDLGVEVKNAEGLVDFRSRRNGHLVYLCWRYGEQSVSHWHDAGTGFEDRSPIVDPNRFKGELLH